MRIITAQWRLIVYCIYAVGCLLAISCAYASDEEKQIPRDENVLEARVQELVAGDNVTLRCDVILLYALIDIYVNDGELEKALPQYDVAVQADGCNLERQLTYARISAQSSEV